MPATDAIADRFTALSLIRQRLVIQHEEEETKELPLGKVERLLATYDEYLETHDGDSLMLLANLTAIGVCLSQWLAEAWQIDPQEVLDQIQYPTTSDAGDNEEDLHGRGLPAFPTLDPDELPIVGRIAQIQYEFARADRAARGIRPANSRLRVVPDA
ncbi:hypothetical protein [Amycolatopsis sp. NPDC051903]|uniref:hypothetical protein n=1 Tax=Amycolatopsis sp. NPDC051903 TaxID=3363936 RepID=UPI0037A2F04D